MCQASGTDFMLLARAMVLRYVAWRRDCRQVVLSRSSTIIILTTNRHRFRLANRYIWQCSFVFGATA